MRVMGMTRMAFLNNEKKYSTLWAVMSYKGILTYHLQGHHEVAHKIGSETRNTKGFQFSIIRKNSD